MISEKYNCLFVHIPKSAGQSITHFFLNLHGLSWTDREQLLMRRNSDPSYGPERLAHMTAQEYVTHRYVPETKFREMYKFSFVRNPWDRLVSEYYYRNYHVRCSFENFVARRLPKKDSFSDIYRHVMPQHEFLYNSDGMILVDFVGRFENLQRDFDHVCQRLAIKNSLLPRVNTSSTRRLRKMVDILLPPSRKRRPRYVDHYDDALAERVYYIYRKDIEDFQYQFGD